MFLLKFLLIILTLSKLLRKIKTISLNYISFMFTTVTRLGMQRRHCIFPRSHLLQDAASAVEQNRTSLPTSLQTRPIGSYGANDERGTRR